MRYTTLPLILILGLYMGCMKSDHTPNYSDEVDEVHEILKTESKAPELSKFKLHHAKENGFKYLTKPPIHIDKIPEGFMEARERFWSERGMEPPTIFRNATVDELPFPANHNYHHETFVLDGQSQMSYNTQCILSMMPEWTTSDYPSWDLTENDTVSTEDLFAILDHYGQPEVPHVNLDSITPIFSGFSSGIESWIEGPVQVDGIVLEDVYCYLFRSTSDEEFLGGDPPYNDAFLNTFFLDIGINQQMNIYYRKY